MTRTVEGQFYPTKEELKNRYLTTIAAQAERNGFEVNVLPGSEYEALKAEAAANVVLPIFANNKLAIDALDPNSAQGDDVTSGAAVYGVQPRPASKAAGQVAARVTSGTVTIVAGFSCTGPNGKQYEATTTTLGVADGDLISVQATEGGTDSNLSAGAIVTWDDPSIGTLRRDATVAVGGIDGGEDEDDTETLRQRWTSKLAASAVGGNWAHVKEVAESASAAVWKAFPYSAPQGAASYGVALVSDSGDRTVDATIVAQVAAAVVAELPGHVNLNATSVTPEEVDLCLAARAPLPTQAGGVGGGWLDGSPWPNTTSGLVSVDSYASNTITTSATALGSVATGSHIAIWDPEDEQVYSYSVATAVDAGNIEITVAGGFLKDHTGAFISAGAENIDEWCASAAEAMLALGPGEKTSSVWLLPRAARKPSPDVESDYALSNKILSAIEADNPEIRDLSYVARFATGTTDELTEPTVPAASTSAPGILVLKHLSFIADV